MSKSLSTLRADLHVHTTYSDNFSTPLQVLTRAAARGLDAVAITDHDTIEGALEAAALAQANPHLPSVIIGEEVSSASGHILGLFLHQRVAPHQSAADTVDVIHAQGGLAVAAPPFWRIGISSLGARVLDRLPLDGIEVVNGVPAPSIMRANRLADHYQSKSLFAATGGSDAHHALAVGWAHTCFLGDSILDLRAALLARSTCPGRLFVNPLDFARYAALGLYHYRRDLLRIAF